MRYVAFLRAINVGGRNMIKMEDLKRLCESLGLKNVRTFIQSGNVLFDSAARNADALARKIEKGIKQQFRLDIAVAVTSLSSLEKLARENPFGKTVASPDVRLFVIFLVAEPPRKPALPDKYDKEAIEVIALGKREACIVCRRKPNGTVGFPNSFVEKEFGVAGTTRDWNTVNRILLLDANK